MIPVESRLLKITWAAVWKLCLGRGSGRKGRPSWKLLAGSNKDGWKNTLAEGEWKTCLRSMFDGIIVYEQRITLAMTYTVKCKFTGVSTVKCPRKKSIITGKETRF